MLYKTVPGLLPASACLELWLSLLLRRAGGGSRCPVCPSSGGWEGNEGWLGLCWGGWEGKAAHLSPVSGGGSAPAVLRKLRAQGSGSETPAPQPGLAASPTAPTCIVLMHCRNVCNVFKPCNRLNNRAAVRLASSLSRRLGGVPWSWVQRSSRDPGRSRLRRLLLPSCPLHSASGARLASAAVPQPPGAGSRAARPLSAAAGIPGPPQPRRRRAPAPSR